MLLLPNSTYQVEGVTKANLLKRFLRDTGLGVTGTATDGDTESLVDTTARASIQFSDQLYEGWWLRIASAGAAAPEDDIRVVDKYTGPAGFFRVLPAWSATIQVGDTYELWMINPQAVLDMLDQVLTEDVYLPCWSILSELPDFDMEQTTTTDWLTVNATAAKSTTEPLMSGKRYLTVTATAGNGYAHSGAIGVEPGRPYVASTLARNITSNGQFIIYDETNGAAISTTTISQSHDVRVIVNFTTPATCKYISIRLATVTNLMETDWDDVVLYSVESKSLSLPWWVKNKSQVKGIFALKNHNSFGDNLYSTELDGELDRRWDIEDTAFGRGQLSVRSRQGTLNTPLFIFGIRNETAYASNTEEKLVDMNYLIACLAYRVFNNLVQTPLNSYLEQDWLKERADYWTKQWKQLSYQQAERLEQVYRSDSPQGNFIDNRFVF